MPADLTAKQIQSQLALTIRHHPDEVERIEKLRRDLRAQQTHDYIVEMVAGFPPLSDSQREALAELLRPGVRQAVPGARRQAASAA